MIVQQESLEWLKNQEADSIDHIITDPPYLISFMGKKWDNKDNIVGSVDYWKEALRVCKAGSYALVFGHSRTHHRVMVAMEDAGWEIRDTIMWLYGSGFPKSHNLSSGIDKKKNKLTSNPVPPYEPISAEAKEWDGWGSALKPAYEPIIMARKPFKGSLADNVLRNGLGGLNIDACRVGTGGRFPANIILSHNPECKLVGTQEEHKEAKTITTKGPKFKSWSDNPTQTRWHNQGFNKLEGNTHTTKELKQTTELYDCEDDCPVKSLDEQSGTLRSGYVAPHHKTKDSSWFGASGKYAGNSTQKNDLVGGASRFFYCPKVSAKERNFGCGDIEIKQTTGGGGLTNVGDKFGSIKAPAKNHHPTIKPIELMKYLVKLVSKEGQVILDPFTGSGSTGIAVELLGRTFIGVEMNEEYCDIAERRITAWKEKQNATE